MSLCDPKVLVPRPALAPQPLSALDKMLNLVKTEELLLSGPQG